MLLATRTRSVAVRSLNRDASTRTHLVALAFSCTSQIILSPNVKACNRRPPQRGKIHAVQRAHCRKGRGRELSLLHRRAERRDGRSARLPSQRARENSAAEEDGAGGRAVRG